MADAYTLENEITTEMLLDDIPVLPGYVQLHSGAYLVSLEKGIELKEIDETNYFSVECTVVEVMEVSEKLGEGEKANAPGDIQSFLWARNHAVAVTNFKNFVTPIAAKFGCQTVQDVIDVSKGLQMIIIGKRTYNKDKDKYNFNYKKVDLA